MLSKILCVLIHSLVFLVPVFFLPFTFEWLEFNKLYLLFFLTWAGVLVWLLKMIVQDKKVQIRYSFLDLAVAGFLAVVLVSSFMSVDKISSLLGSYGRFVPSALLYFTLAGLYFLISNNTTKEESNAYESSYETEEDKKNKKTKTQIISTGGVIKSLVCSGLAVLFFVFLALFGVWKGALGRLIASPASATSPGTAMFLASILVLAVFVFLGGLIWGKFQKSKSDKKWKIISLIYIIFALIALAIADFAAAWVSLIFGLFLIIIIAAKRQALKERTYLFMVPIAVFIVSCLFLVLNLSNIFYGTFLEDSPLVLREMKLPHSESWQVSGRVLGSGFGNALLGNGPGTFGYSFSRFRPESLNIREVWSIRFDRAGSYLSETLANIGILGFLAYLALILILFFFALEAKKLLRFKKQEQESEKTDTGTLVLAAFLLILFLGQFFYYQTISLAFLFWLLMGTAVGWKGAQNQKKEKSFIKTRTFLTEEAPEVALVTQALAIVIGLLWLSALVFGIRFYLADVKYVQALNNPDLEQKTELLSNSVRFNSLFPRYKLVLSQVYMRRAEEVAIQITEEQDREKAIGFIAMAKLLAEEAVIMSPNRIIALENLANIYHRIMGLAEEREEFAEMAIEVLKQALTLEPKSPGLYADIGDIYFALNKRAEAREYFEKSVIQIDLFVRGEISLALLLEGDNRIEEAIEKLKNVVKRASQNIDALFHLGRLYYNQEKIDEAVDYFQTVIRLNPNHSNARFALALAYEKQGKTDEAIEELKIVAEMNPHNEEIKEIIARLERGEPLDEEIIEDIELADGEEDVDGEIGEIEEDYEEDDDDDED